MRIVTSLRMALLGALLVVSGHTLAYTIDDGGVLIDVGLADSVISSTTLASSGEAVETAWVESVLGFSISFTAKVEDAGLSWSQAIDGTDVYAHFLSTDPEYFLVKIGTGSSGFDTHFLFSNVDALSYAVFDLAALGIDPASMTFDFFAISHIAEFSVPESTTLILLGLGLLGLGLFSRRSRK